MRIPDRVKILIYTKEPDQWILGIKGQSANYFKMTKKGNSYQIETDVIIYYIHGEVRESQRGMKVDHIYLDTEVSEELIQTILLPMIRPGLTRRIRGY